MSEGQGLKAARDHAPSACGATEKTPLPPVAPGDIYYAAWSESIARPDLFNAALDALHSYAQATDAGAGANVITWFRDRSNKANERGQAALAAAREHSSPRQVVDASPGDAK